MAAVPNAVVPNAVVPNAVVPLSVVPRSVAPNAVVPNAVVPHNPAALCDLYLTPLDVGCLQPLGPVGGVGVPASPDEDIGVYVAHIAPILSSAPCAALIWYSSRCREECKH
ncbi:MAG: hypothetical protein WC966_12025 [Bradymonadales bacterium]